MFCPKCGLELPEGSSFCPACGAKLDIQQEEQAAEPVFEPVVREKSEGKIFSLPKLSGWIKLGITFTAFVLGYTIMYISGLANVFMWLAIPLFPVAIACDLLNMDVLAGKAKIFAIAKKFGKIAYFGLYCIALTIMLLAAIGSRYIDLGFTWYLSVLVAVPGLVLCFIPDLLQKIGIKD